MYVYDREDILFEFDENDRIKARYTHGPGIDEPISVDRDTDGDGVLDVTYFYHYDGLGSVIAMTDSAGNIVQTYVYDTFGNIVQQSGNVENVYTYTGREWDSEAGLYYYRARYYDPTRGRFINGDPIGFAGGDVNFYVYVANNPVNFIDPSGENPFTDTFVQAYNAVTYYGSLYGSYIIDNGSNTVDLFFKVSDSTQNYLETSRYEYNSAVDKAFGAAWDFIEPHSTASSMADFAELPSGAFNTIPSVSSNTTSVSSTSNRNGGCSR